MVLYIDSKQLREFIYNMNGVFTLNVSGSEITHTHTHSQCKEANRHNITLGDT